MNRVHLRFMTAGVSTILLCVAPFSSGNAQTPDSQRVPHVIQLNPAAVESTDVLKGPPETYTMRSGYMVLAPTKSVGLHTTRKNEEALVVLSGKGELKITGGPTVQLKGPCVAYCPPMTEHDIFSTGPDTLRYIWLVAKALP